MEFLGRDSQGAERQIPGDCFKLAKGNEGATREAGVFIVKPTRPMVMRIITRLGGGGPPVHVTLLNRRLPDFGLPCVLIYGACGQSEANMEYLLQPNDEVLHIPELVPNIKPWFDLIAFVKLWWVMFRLRPQIVHTHTAKAGLLGRLAAILAAVPCVVHTYHGHVLENYFGPAVNRILCHVERALAYFTQALCTVSRQQAKELTDKFAVAPAEKFHIVPLGLDLGPYLSMEKPDFWQEHLTILWLGRFVPIKNLPLLLEVVERCEQDNLPIDFILAGEGDQRPWIEEQIALKGLRRIELLPWQTDIRAVLRRSHLMILTSHREGTPLALIQGLAAGRPFIATPVGGTVDLVGPINPHSCLVEPDSAAFVAKLRELLGNRAQLEAMSSRGIDFANTHFAEQRLIKDLVNLYRELIATEKSGVR